MHPAQEGDDLAVEVLGRVEHHGVGAARKARAPGIVILGRHDPVVRRGFARELAEALPGGRCVELERGAHAVVFDAAEDFNREVAAFLRRVHPPG